MEVEQQAPGPSTAAARPPAASPGAPQNATPEHRSHIRYPIQENSVLLVLNHGLSLECRILDLSLSGCRLQASQPLIAAPRTRVEVAFKVHGVAFRLLGIVQWNRENRLLGIRFTETIPRRAEQLAEVIGELEAAARARAAQQAAEKAAAETEAAQHAREQTEAEARHWAEIQQIARKARARRKAVALAPHRSGAVNARAPCPRAPRA